MRVIAGAYRSRRLLSPPGTATRPTSDRLRETLFNVLAPRIPGSHFVDLYAGTGAVGIEALSRGARHVSFAENAPSALKTLRANLSALRITTGFTLEERGAMPLLQRLPSAAAGAPGVDILFLDPPYNEEAAYTQTLGLLGHARLLAAHALVVAEHATRSPFRLPARAGLLVQTRSLKQGDTSLTFYTLSEPESSGWQPPQPPLHASSPASGKRSTPDGAALQLHPERHLTIRHQVPPQPV